MGVSDAIKCKKRKEGLLLLNFVTLSVEGGLVNILKNQTNKQTQTRGCNRRSRKCACARTRTHTHVHTHTHTYTHVHTHLSLIHI